MALFAFGKILKDWKDPRGGERPQEETKATSHKGVEAGWHGAKEWADGEDPGLAPQGWVGGPGVQVLEECTSPIRLSIHLESSGHAPG